MNRRRVGEALWAQFVGRALQEMSVFVLPAGGMTIVADSELKRDKQVP